MYVCRVDGEAKLTFFFIFRNSLINANLPFQAQAEDNFKGSLPSYFNSNL